MKTHSILIVVSVLLWSVIDLCGIQRPQFKALVLPDNVTKIEKISSTASAALIPCVMVANKMELDIYDALYFLSRGMVATNVISNGILWVAYKKRRAAYQLIPSLFLLSTIFLNKANYICDDPVACKC